MEHKALLQPFELYISGLENWNRRPLVYHFFEIVQVLEGEGIRITNRNNFAYCKGSIFLFTPLDCRGFDSKTPTRFCSIRFSEVFLGQCKTMQEREKIRTWLRQLEQIFSHHNNFGAVLIRQPADAGILSALIQSMIEEYRQKQVNHEENLQHFITLILNVLSRNVSIDDTKAGTEQEQPANRILLHIQQHIRSPEKLTVGYLATRFNLSKNYISEYFKKFTGKSLRDYITRYKIRLVQQRLANSTLTISQIADELGFTDESHLSRQFKKHSGLSPLAYRKKVKTKR
jgi:YesN/AraC family two-component response regulator